MELDEHKYIESLTDKEVVSAILNRDARITRLYLYEKCYPLFKSCYDKYYTDCETCVEFINQIYLLIMAPRKSTGVSPLQTFSFRCTLPMWLKIIAENYCKQLFRKKANFSDGILTESDRLNFQDDSLDLDFRSIYASDVKRLVKEVHKRNMMIVADFVPNHCHITNPLYAEGKHKDCSYLIEKVM